RRSTVLPYTTLFRSAYREADRHAAAGAAALIAGAGGVAVNALVNAAAGEVDAEERAAGGGGRGGVGPRGGRVDGLRRQVDLVIRSEEHTSELQSRGH